MEEESPDGAFRANIKDPDAQIENLNLTIQRLHQEKADLEVLLDIIMGHSDSLLVEMHQEKVDLEILLETTTEHSDAMEWDLHTQAEEAKRQVEEQFRLIAEATPVAILISRIADGQILYANAMSSLMFGLQPQVLLKQKTLDFYCDAEEHQTFTKLLTEKQQFRSELQLKRANGELFWALLSIRPFLFKRETTLLTAFFDITDRKKSEAALQLAEAKYRSIFENAADGIFQTTAEGRYVSVNPAMAILCGYASPQDMLANVTHMTHLFVDPERRDTFKQMLEAQGEVKNFEYQIYQQDGVKVWIEANVKAIYDSGKCLLHYEGLARNITDRKHKEAALERQLQELQSAIDKTKRDQEVAEIIEQASFQSLKQKLQQAKAARKAKNQSNV